MGLGLPFYVLGIVFLFVGQSLAEFTTAGSKTTFDASTNTSDHGILLTGTESLTGKFTAKGINLPDGTTIGITLGFGGCEIKKELLDVGGNPTFYDSDTLAAYPFDLKLDVKKDKVTIIDKNNQNYTMNCTVDFEQIGGDGKAKLAVGIQLEKLVPGLTFEFDAPLYVPPPPTPATIITDFDLKPKQKRNKLDEWKFTILLIGGFLIYLVVILCIASRYP
ncbi:hypothetical protein M3Y94_01283300 [Aphelenchoides besseyi]|nr:hypothetical protein M3Y94_01283300 [Aphelenchoides besseyi]